MVIGPRLALVGALGLALAAGCDPDPDPGPGSELGVNGLSPAELMTRASLDLRGVRPSPAELAALARDPDSLDTVIAQFVDDPAFAERMKDMFAGAWRTRVDEYELPPDTPLTDEERALLNRAIGEEPLNLVAYIALNDLPLTQLLTSQDTFVDPALIGYWPLTQLADAGALPQGVVRARYTDERPMAGVLSQNSFYWRHSSTQENANRGRANALSQALLCQSYLDRPIDFPSDLDLTNSDSIRNAVANNDACQGCHSTMDPLASYMWGFMYGEADLPEAHYSPAQERAWKLHTDAAPAFFGKPGQRMEDLAQHIANDERFVSCAVRRVYEGMLGREAVVADEGALAEHREAFLSGGLKLAALVRSILEDPSYRGRPWKPRFGGQPQPVREKLAPLGVLASSLTELSGYALTLEGREAVDLDLGLRTLAGGSDRGDATDVSIGAVLVQRRLAEAGAIYALERVTAGAQGPSGALDGFLRQVDLDRAPSIAQLVGLIELTRSRALDPNDPELAALGRVWADVEAISTPREAWLALVTAVLADPDHLIY